MSGNAKGSEAPAAGHHCHARGCEKEVPPKLLMCLRHWRMVPRDLQRAVWATYVPGQEIRKDPTPEYIQAHLAAVEAVARKEATAMTPLVCRCPPTNAAFPDAAVCPVHGTGQPPAGPSASLSEALTGKEGLEAAAQAERLRELERLFFGTLAGLLLAVPEDPEKIDAWLRERVAYARGQYDRLPRTPEQPRAAPTDPSREVILVPALPVDHEADAMMEKWRAEHDSGERRRPLNPSPAGPKDLERAAAPRAECDGNSQCTCSSCRRIAKADARPRRYGDDT